MDLTTVAVPYTLAHLKPLLPAPPARIAEAGCGEGALAAALTELGYEVTGVDRNAEMTASARKRGVRVIEADINEVSGQYDVVLFTRSLHHADNLDDTVAHAVTLLAPGAKSSSKNLPGSRSTTPPPTSSTKTVRSWLPPSCSRRTFLPKIC